jgi:hypothetical protein
VTEKGDEEPLFWSLQDGIDSGAWPEEAREATAGLHQGSLVESPPFVYAASAGHPIHDTTRAWSTSPKAETGVVNVLPAGQRPRYGLIVTQTCDLVEEGKPKRPWALIAPVYVLFTNAGARRRILEGRAFDYLVPITGLEPPDGGLWVGDLRLLIPVEKGWLVGCISIDGFTSEHEFDRLADRLSKRFARPAYAASIVDHVLKPSYELWADIIERYEGEDPIVDVGLEVGRSRLDPVNAQLVFLLDEDISAELRGYIVDWWQPLSERARSAGLEFLTPRFVRLDQLTALEYRRLSILDAAALSPVDEEPPT